MMNTSTTATMTRYRYAAVLLGALAAVTVAPATAFAADNDPSGPGGCNYTDADGYNIPIHDGEDVFVDGKIVSCRGGQVTVTTAPLSGANNSRPPLVNGNAPVVNEPPRQQPVLTWTVPVFNARS